MSRIEGLPEIPEGGASPELDLIFDKAKTEFLQSLTVGEQLQFSSCSSAQSLLAEVKKFEAVVKAKQRGLRYVQKIQSFSDNLEPYFKIIEIICGAHPEYVNFAWGAFRLILQLASQFATFFDKLCENVRKISLALPQYEDVFRSLESGSKDFISKRLRNSMMMFYSDLFEFFQAVARVFSDRKGKLKRTPEVIGSLLWKPFDVRFQSVLERLSFHQALVKEELHWATMGELRSTMQGVAQRSENEREDILQTRTTTSILAEKFDKSQMDAFCVSVIKWLNPPEFMTAFEQAQDARESGTAEWLIDNTKFQGWRRNNSGGPILWVQGNPGWGKTVLAASVVEELRDDQSEPTIPQPIICYYFFCQRGAERAVRVEAYRALATQLFQQCGNLEEIYNIFQIAKAVDVVSASEHELIDLLQLTLAQLANVVFVLDGVDECIDNAKLFQELCQFAASSQLKIILFSRPNISCLRRCIKEDCTVLMSRDILDKDISVFLDSELLLLRDASLLPLDAELSAFREIILERADGMFLWARLLIVYLNSAALTRAERVYEITKSTPEGLDDMYNRIFNHIKSLDRASRQLASRIFMWVGYAKSFMTPAHIKEVVWGPDSSSRGGDQVDDFEHAIIVSCCGLIEKRQNKQLHFVHLTAQEFILSPHLCSDSKIPFVLLEKEAASEIVENCLSYLVTAISPRPLGGDIHMSASTSSLRAQYPFLEYASTKWPQHLKDAYQESVTGLNLSHARSLALATALEKFLAAKSNLMVWVEAMYTYGDISFIESISAAVAFLAGSLESQGLTEFELSLRKAFHDLRDLAAALKDVHTEWGSTLLLRPHEIWNDLTVFNPNRFFLQTSAATLGTFALQPQAAVGFSSQALFQISSNSPDGQRIGSLSIWPSQAFADFWEAQKQDKSKGAPSTHVLLPEIAMGELLSFSNGWNARYEIFALDEQAIPQASAKISLVESEIALLLGQSLRPSVLKHWKLSFPMIISSDLSNIIVLRTIFAFDTNRLGNNTSMDYCSDIFSLHSPNWSPPSPSAPCLQFTYSYEWLISTDSRFAVFRSHDRSLTGQEPITIFRIINNANTRIQLHQVKAISINAEPVNGYTPCALHPQRPQLIFVTCTAVWLADFEEENNPVKLLDLERDKGDNIGSSTRWHEHPFREGNIKSIGFSACGDYFTIAYHGVTWPQVHPLYQSRHTKHLPSSSKAVEVLTLPDMNPKKRLLEQESHESSLCSVMRTSKMPKVVDTSSLVLNHRPETNIQTQIQVSHEAMPQNIQLATQAQDLTTRTLSLARVPKSINLRYTNTTVLWPESKRESIQVILNAGAKPSYDSDESNVSPFLPAVLTRDPRSLAAPREVSKKEIQEDTIWTISTVKPLNSGNDLRLPKITFPTAEP